MKGYAFGHALGQAIARVGLLGVACSLLAYIGGFLSRPMVIGSLGWLHRRRGVAGRRGN